MVDGKYINIPALRTVHHFWGPVCQYFYGWKRRWKDIWKIFLFFAYH